MLLTHGGVQVFVPLVYQPENPDEPDGAQKLIAPVVPPAYPKEDWKTYNDEQTDLRDHMYLEQEELNKKEKEEEEATRKAKEEEAVNTDD